jgi:hypothetical protein
LALGSAPGRIRTSDQQLRRLLLYPPELRARELLLTNLAARCHERLPSGARLWLQGQPYNPVKMYSTLKSSSLSSSSSLNFMKTPKTPPSAQPRANQGSEARRCPFARSSNAKRASRACGTSRLKNQRPVDAQQVDRRVGEIQQTASAELGVRGSTRYSTTVVARARGRHCFAAMHQNDAVICYMA